jgi:hypothetical protein
MGVPVPLTVRLPAQRREATTTHVTTFKYQPERQQLRAITSDLSHVGHARAGMDDGEVWADAMARTLELLDAACTKTASS